ncbi:MAG: Uma2 family endonuclease [Acidimicrobiales bacterium]
MASSLALHDGPWTEDDLASLPESQRYELLAGSLVVSPPPPPLHQRTSFMLASALEARVPSGLIVIEATGVRLDGGSVFIPDVLVAEREPALANRSGILEASLVRLVVEIVSPGSGAKDRLTKPSLYAQSGIPAFWRVELDDGPSVYAYRLDGTSYVEVAAGRPGARMILSDPFPVTFDPADLRP